MKRTLHISTLMLVFAVTMLIWLGFQNPVMADVPSQRLMTPTRPATGPVIPPASVPPTASIASSIITKNLLGPPLPDRMTYAKSKPATPRLPGNLVDNWERLVRDDFEGTFPITSSCYTHEDSNLGMLWDKDTLHPYSGSNSIWPAKGGQHGINPLTNDYPPGLDTWLVCGPYDFTNAQFLQIDFKFWRQYTDGDDYLGVLYSLTGTSWDGLLYGGLNPLPTPLWMTQKLVFPWEGLSPIDGQPRVWVGVVFHSDLDAIVGQGAWVDDLQIWRYNKPSITCGNPNSPDPGNKGVHLPSHEIAADQHRYPIIRNGDIQALTGIIAAGAKWVRLGFKPADPASEYSQEQEYDRMVDSLCAAGINVLGLVNHETLSRPGSDVNDPSQADSYRQEFADTASRFARHFKGRIRFWEVWNEPFNSKQPPFVLENRYAALLTSSYNSIKSANPDAHVIFGGLASAWNNATDYLLKVYQFLDSDQGGARPFDYFALHPYFDDTHGLDPSMYMHASEHMTPTLGDRTIIDKFVRIMEAKGDAGKKIWITEVGWNSAKGESNVNCLANVVVDIVSQAIYLKKGFDILYNEARSVDKIFWYQYMDTRSDACNTASPQHTVWSVPKPARDLFDPYSPTANEPGYYGLYGADKHTPKLSQCAFAAYPQPCAQIRSLFLPLILKNP